MRQVAGWLRALGLGQYAQTFAENGIDFEVLPELTDQDLEKLGVLLGHRRKMLHAIAALDHPAPGRREARGGLAASDMAERRQLTLMFCDLVGSTALSARLDPEDLRRVYRAYRDGCARVVARYDGMIAQFMGDGVLVYFGFPRAHEDDAERAVRAGLDILAAVSWLKTPLGGQVEARVGIATGLVVVGDLVGQVSVQEQAVVGATAHLAARLQALAEPGTVVVAASTRKLLGEMFRLRALGDLVVKGLAESVEAWAVEGEASSESRFEMVRARGLTSFVGREQEVGLLTERQQQAWQGEGQILLISGEAGIGKSRFAARISEHIADQPHTRLRYQCSPHHTMSAFYPIIEQLKRVAGFRPGDPIATKLDKLEATLALATAKVADVAPLFAALLSLPSEDRYPPLGFSAAQRRQQLLAALLDQLEGLARKNPVLLVFEDVHWADASTLEVLDLMAKRVAGMPVLALITCRSSEFGPPWDDLANATTLTLGRLDQTQARAMIDQLSAGKRLPDEVTAQIVAKTDGVPLFVEELTKTVLESGLLVEEAERYRLDGPLPPLAIPATLQDSLMARLDRLAHVREIAEIAALIGREFPYALLHAVVGRDRETLDDALAQLEAAELLFCTGAAPDARYRFKHALVQEVAYENMLRMRRQVLHHRIADTLCKQFPAVAEAEPEAVARHLTQAGLTEPAVEWWSKAGEQALGRSAFIEAIAHYGEALTLAGTLPNERAQRLRLLQLHLAYGQASIASRGHGAPETIDVFARARALAAEIDDPQGQLSALYGLWAGSNVRGELASAKELAGAFLREAERRPGSPEIGVGHWIVGMTHFLAGDLVLSLEHLERAVALYDAERDRALRFRFGQDPGVAAIFQLAMVLWQIGELARARKLADDGLTLALQSRHVPTIACGYGCRCLFEGMRDDESQARPSAEALSDLIREHGLRSTWLGIGNFFLGFVRGRGGDRTIGMTDMRKGVAYFREQGFFLYLALLRVLLAETEAAADDIDAALATVDAAFADAEQTGHRWYQSEAHRIRAELLLRRRRSDLLGAEEAFERGLAIARSQQARSFELRSALGLARLYCATGREQAVPDLLTPILAAFREAPDLPEVEQARRLLGFPQDGRLPT